MTPDGIGAPVGIICGAACAAPAKAAAMTNCVIWTMVKRLEEYERVISRVGGDERCNKQVPATLSMRSTGSVSMRSCYHIRKMHAIMCSVSQRQGACLSKATLTACLPHRASVPSVRHLKLNHNITNLTSRRRSIDDFFEDCAGGVSCAASAQILTAPNARSLRTLLYISLTIFNMDVDEPRPSDPGKSCFRQSICVVYPDRIRQMHLKHET